LYTVYGNLRYQVVVSKKHECKIGLLFGEKESDSREKPTVRLGTVA